MSPRNHSYKISIFLLHSAQSLHRHFM